MVGHIENTKKTYLPFNYRPQYIKEIYSSKIIGIHKDYACYASADVGEKSTKEALWDLANENKATAIVTGMHGRKGLKSDPTVAGTAVSYLSMNASVPVIIIKDPITRSMKKSGWFRFGVCFDSSEKSLRVLRYTLGIMRPEDHIAIITCKELRIDMAAVEKTITEVCAEFNRTEHELVILTAETGATIYKTIQHYLI